VTRPTLNRETLAAYKWLCEGEPGNVCNRIVREVEAHAWVADKVAEIAAQIHGLVMESFPAIAKPGEPDDFRETMRAGLARVDWQEIALLFVEQERWRARARALKVKRAAARRRRK
jgi:hypothetical protein